jgi:hypothetical protein
MQFVSIGELEDIFEGTVVKLIILLIKFFSFIRHAPQHDFTRGWGVKFSITNTPIDFKNVRLENPRSCLLLKEFFNSSWLQPKPTGIVVDFLNFLSALDGIQ